MAEEQRRIVYMNAEQMEWDLGNSGMGKTNGRFYIIEINEDQFRQTKDFFARKGIELHDDQTGQRYTKELNDRYSTATRFFAIGIDKQQLTDSIPEADRIKVDTALQAKFELGGMATYRQYVNKGGGTGQPGAGYPGRQ